MARVAEEKRVMDRVFIFVLIWVDDVFVRVIGAMLGEA
jgi:hypothetical protein